MRVNTIIFSERGSVGETDADPEGNHTGSPNPQSYSGFSALHFNQWLATPKRNVRPGRGRIVTEPRLLLLASDVCPADLAGTPVPSPVSIGPASVLQRASQTNW